MALGFAALVALTTTTRERLNDRGIGRGDRVALVIPERPEMAAAYLAVCDAATVVPLNPESTEREFAANFVRTKVDAVIVSVAADTAARRAAEPLGLPLIHLHPRPDAAAGVFELDGGRLDRPVRREVAAPGDIARVQMTSGTTARPKLVPMSQSLLVRRAHCEVAALGLRPTDRCLSFRPLFLSGGLNTDLLVPLSAGGAIVVPAGFDADDFYGYLDDFGVTWYSGGPAYHEAILDRAPGHADVIARSALRFVRSASHRLMPDLMQRLEQTFGVPCLERFGGTEAGLITRNPPPPGERRPGTAGLPFDNEVAIVDAAGRRLGVGDAGEVIVRGPNVFTGYEDDPEATAAAFIDGWFRTGDLGRFDADGYLTVIGRLKEVINRGGQKVSPSEVEEVLSRHPQVAECMCFALPHPTLGEEVAAAVVLRPTADAGERELQAFLRACLAEYKVPRRIVFRASLPRGPHGKLARIGASARLGMGAGSGVRGSGANADPPPTAAPRRARPPMITALAALWADVLRLPDVDADENFFVLGGDSLRAASLVSAVSETFGVRLSLNSIFGTGATVEGMAAAIVSAREQTPTARGDAADAAKLDRIHPRDRSQPRPPSFTQQRLLFLSRLEPLGRLYNLQGAVRISGPLDRAVLARVLNAIVERHEILRASFPVVDGEATQVFAPELELDIAVSDLSAWPAETRDEEVERLAIAEASTPFDLERGPLIRCRLLQLAPDEHVLLLPKHHVVFDGRSSGLLYAEFGALYPAFANGEASPLPPLPIQYGDFAAWQRGRLNGPYRQELLDFWLRHLEGAPRLVDLPTDRPRPAIQSYRGRRQWFQIPEATTRQLREIGRRHGITLYMTLLAAFQILIHRHTGQDDFIVGTAIDNRDDQTRHAIGLFLNTLALRCRLEAALTVPEHLQRVRDVVLDAFQHRWLPFEDLVDRIKPSRDAGYAPIVQILFGFMPTDQRVVDLPGLRLERIDIDLGTTRFDLCLMMAEDRGSLEGFFEYATDLFEDSTIARLMRSFQVLLQEMIADPEGPVSALALVDDAERRLLSAWSGTRTPYPHDGIPALFAAQVRARPDAVAIVCGARRLSYEALNAWANRLAHRLQRHGVGAASVVGISARRSPAMIAGLLGILKAGGAYLALDAAYPAERLRFMIEDAGVGMLLVEDGLLPPLDGVAARTVRLDPDGADLDDEAADDPPDAGDADALAYVVYTSGSTGQPKGCGATHRGVVRLVRNTDYATFGADEVFLQLAPITFDASTFEIWGALLNGGRLQQVAAELPTLDEIARTIEAGGVTTVWLTAGLFHQMVDHEIRCFRQVRQVLAGGDVLSVDHVKRFVAALPTCRLINGYGPTENTTFTCTYTVGDPSRLEPSVPIGRPIANTTVHVLDRHRNPVPIGAIGELYIGGDGLARGYLNRPELTAERFVPDPFDDRPDARLYRSGDRVRYLADGNLQFLGRMDDQVKIRGFRIEPGEIETTLQQHPGVRQAAVAARDDGQGSRRLIAYVVARDPAAAPATSDLSAFLAGRLPAYMRPSAFVALDALPITAVGKLDREALVRIGSPEVAAGRAPIWPRTPLEEAVAAIWSDLLGLDRVGVQESFFDLGGHSLAAMKMLFLVEERLGVDLPLQLVFASPTIEGLALAMTERMLAEVDDALAPGA